MLTLGLKHEERLFITNRETGEQIVVALTSGAKCRLSIKAATEKCGVYWISSTAV